MRQALELRTVNRHPDSERFDALTTGALQLIGGLASAFIITGLVGLANSPITSALLCVSLVPGIWTIAGWYLRKRRGSTIYLAELPRGWRPLIESMAANADEIASLAEATPEGPLRSHLIESANAAHQTVRSAELAARRSGKHATPNTAASQDAIDLARLAASVSELADTAAIANATRPLADLAERSEQLQRALDEAHEHDLTK